MKLLCAGLLGVVALVSGEGTCSAGECKGGLDIITMQTLLEDHWEAQAAGEAEKFVNNLTPDAKFIVNGEEDNAPWTDLQFVKDLFSRVTYGEVEPVAPIVFVEPNTVMTVIEWGVTVRNTFEYQPMGAWQQKVVFADDGKIASVTSVCDGLYLSRFGTLLEPSDLDNKANMLGVVEAYNSGDAEVVTTKFDPYQVHWTRSRQEDFANWARPHFLKVLFDKCKVQVSLDSFADADVRASYAVLTWTITVPGDDEPIIFQDAWYITWNPDGQIAQVASVTDSHALAAVYGAIDYQPPAQAPGRGGPGGPGGPPPGFDPNNLSPEQIAELEKQMDPETLAKLRKMQEEQMAA